MTFPELLVSVVVPLANDSDILPEFVAELDVVLAHHYQHYEVILVDDGSTDDTRARAAELLRTVPNLRVVVLSRRFGQEIAISAGLDSAIGDFVVIMLPDCDPPSLVPAMIEHARSGVGVVLGVRTDRGADRWIHRAGARLFYALASACGIPLHRDATHFRVLSRGAVNALTRLRSPKRYLRTLSESVGFGTAAIAYGQRQVRSRRRHPRSGELVRLGVDIVVTNSTWPLRAVSNLALLGAGCAGLLVGYVVIIALFKAHVAEGWVSIVGPIAVIATLLLLSLGTVGHYLTRLLESQPDGPLYHVVDELNSEVASPSMRVRNIVTHSTGDADDGQDG